MSYIHLRRFIEKARAVDPSRSKEFIMTAQEAQGLHADISKLLTDLHELSQQSVPEKNTNIEITGGGF